MPSDDTTLFGNQPGVGGIVFLVLLVIVADLWYRIRTLRQAQPGVDDAE